MNYNTSTQFVLFTIYFKGSKYRNFLGTIPEIYNHSKEGKLYYVFIKDFIYNKIYAIFGAEIIGEIVYDRISITEFYRLRKDVPEFETLFKNELSNVTTNVGENHIIASESNKAK